LRGPPPPSDWLSFEQQIASNHETSAVHAFTILIMNEYKPSLIPEAAFEALRNRILSNPECRNGWSNFDRRMRSFDANKITSLEQRAEDLKARAEALGNKKVLSYGNFLRRIAEDAAELAAHYRVTGEKMSSQAAIRLSKLVFDRQSWTFQGETIGWKSDLWTADLCTSMSLALDHLGESLGSQEREKWSIALRERGIDPILRDWIDPDHRIHALDTMGHNWWSVCVAGATIGLFAVRNSFDDTEDCLQRIERSIIEFFAYPGNVLLNKHRTFGREGDFVEPIGYLDYALQNLVIVFDLFTYHLDKDLVSRLPALAEIGNYYLTSVQPVNDTAYLLNFGDMGYEKATIDGYSKHHLIGVWLWLAKRFQLEGLFHLARRVSGTPSRFFEFLFWPDDLKGESFVGSPGDTVYSNIGVAVLRSGYGANDTVFAIKTGEKWNHNHSDSGSFILSTAGRQFIIDPGTTEYSSPLHQQYFKTHHAHNLILRNERGPDQEMNILGTKWPGSIPAHIFSPGYKYLLADATGQWEGIYRRFYRHILWIDNFIVLIDDLMARDPGEWTQLLHYNGVAKYADGRTELRNGDKSLIINHLFPSVESAEIRTGYLSSLKNSIVESYKYECDIKEVPYLALKYPDKGFREKFIQIIELPNASIEVEAIQESGIQGARIVGQDKVWEILCNVEADGRRAEQNSHIRYGNISTDAFVTAVCRNRQGEIMTAGIHHGSYLRINGKTWLNGLLKSDIVVSYDISETRLYGFLASPSSLDIRLGGGNRQTKEFSAGEIFHVFPR
jgi:hypothetical protein